MNGIRIRFETNPATSRASTGSLPTSRASATIVAAVSSDVSARITSTSRITGTGLKKCMPTTRPGRPVAAASVAIGIELVFDARMAPSGKTLVGAAEQLLLDGRVLDDRLDHELGRNEVADRRDARQRLVRIRAALGGQLHEARVHRLARPLERLRRRVVQRDPPPGGGHDLRDAAAHLAGADDQYVPDSMAADPTLRPWS